MDRLKSFFHDDEGASAIEYALIAGLIAVVIVGALTTLGTDISGLFTYVGSKLPKAP